VTYSNGEFDPEDMGTWPIPDHAVLTRYEDGHPRRMSEYGEGWRDGFDLALQMANRWFHSGEWTTDP